MSSRLRRSSRNYLRTLMELWLQAKEAQGISPRTIEMYRDTVSRFIQYLEAKKITTPEQVEPTTIREYLINRKPHVKSQTLHNYFRIPKMMWRWCVRQGLMESNPFEKVEAPRMEKVIKRALTQQEVVALLNACRGSDWLSLRDKALILLLLDTGLRIQEALGLRVSDIQGTSCLVRGKGAKWRLVSFTPETRTALFRYLKACPFHPTESDPVWYGAKGAMTIHGMKLAVRRVSREAGLNIGPHQLRRTFATWTLRQGINLEHLRVLMGHSDLKVLQQYLALVEEDLKQAHKDFSPINLIRGKINNR